MFVLNLIQKYMKPFAHTVYKIYNTHLLILILIKVSKKHNIFQIF